MLKYNMPTLIRLFRTKEDLEYSEVIKHENSRDYIVVAIAASGRDILGIYHFVGNFKDTDQVDYISKKFGLENNNIFSWVADYDREAYDHYSKAMDLVNDYKETNGFIYQFRGPLRGGSRKIKRSKKKVSKRKKYSKKKYSKKRYSKNKKHSKIKRSKKKYSKRLKNKRR